jgi:hypothetical protein
MLNDDDDFVPDSELEKKDTKTTEEKLRENNSNLRSEVIMFRILGVAAMLVLLGSLLKNC